MEHSQIRLLIVDDHALFRKIILQSVRDDPRIEVIGIADGGVQALAMCRTLRPDVVLSDLHMPSGDGFRFVEEISIFGDEKPAVLVMTGDDTIEAGHRAFAAGASGYLLKDNVTEESLVSAIYALADGGIYVDPHIFARLIEPALIVDKRDRVAELNSAELELLRVVALGYDNKQIAQLLSVTSKTVSNRLSMLYMALGVTNRVQAANLAYRADVVHLQDLTF